jgi:hypothetical protein
MPINPIGYWNAFLKQKQPNSFTKPPSVPQFTPGVPSTNSPGFLHFCHYKECQALESPSYDWPYIFATLI